MTRPALTVSIASQRPTATWISEPAWDARYLRTISIEFEEDDCLYDYALYDQYTKLDGDLPTPPAIQQLFSVSASRRTRDFLPPPPPRKQLLDSNTTPYSQLIGTCSAVDKRLTTHQTPMSRKRGSNLGTLTRQSLNPVSPTQIPLPMSPGPQAVSMHGVSHSLAALTANSNAAVNASKSKRPAGSGISLDRGSTNWNEKTPTQRVRSLPSANGPRAETPNATPSSGSSHVPPRPPARSPLRAAARQHPATPQQSRSSPLPSTTKSQSKDNTKRPGLKETKTHSEPSSRAQTSASNPSLDMFSSTSTKGTTVERELDKFKNKRQLYQSGQSGVTFASLLEMYAPANQPPPPAMPALPNIILPIEVTNAAAVANAARERPAFRGRERSGSGGSTASLASRKKRSGLSVESTNTHGAVKERVVSPTFAPGRMSTTSLSTSTSGNRDRSRSDPLGRDSVASPPPTDSDAGSSTVRGIPSPTSTIFPKSASTGSLPDHPAPPVTKQKRQHALLELLNTERAYASDLVLVQGVHMPLALGLNVQIGGEIIGLGQPPTTVTSTATNGTSTNTLSITSSSASTHTASSRGSGLSISGSSGPPNPLAASTSTQAQATAATTATTATATATATDERQSPSPANNEPPMTQDDVRVIFGNIEQLAVFADGFAEEIETALGAEIPGGKGVDRVGELFVKRIPIMTPIFCQFMVRHATALSRFAHLEANATPAMKQYLEDTKAISMAHSNAWNISSLLIKPVQRFTKYPLLLAAIVDATFEEHPDYQGLLDAKSMMLDAVKKVNEASRRRDIVRAVLEGKGLKGVVATVAPAAAALATTGSVGRIKSLRSGFSVGRKDKDKDKAAGEEDATANGTNGAISPGLNGSFDDTGTDKTPGGALDDLHKRLREFEAMIPKYTNDVIAWVKSVRETLVRLEAWTLAFEKVIALSDEGGIEALQAFRNVLADRLTGVIDALDGVVHFTLIPSLVKLADTMKGPLLLLQTAGTLRSSYVQLLNTPYGGKNGKPPQSLVDASGAYIALAEQLCIELPVYLKQLDHGFALIITQVARWQQKWWNEVAGAWSDLWRALGVGPGDRKSYKVRRNRERARKKGYKAAEEAGPPPEPGEYGCDAQETSAIWWERWEEIGAMLAEYDISSGATIIRAKEMKKNFALLRSSSRLGAGTDTEFSDLQSEYEHVGSPPINSALNSFLPEVSPNGNKKPKKLKHSPSAGQLRNLSNDTFSISSTTGQATNTVGGSTLFGFGRRKSGPKDKEKAGEKEKGIKSKDKAPEAIRRRTEPTIPTRNKSRDEPVLVTAEPEALPEPLPRRASLKKKATGESSKRDGDTSSVRNGKTQRSSEPLAPRERITSVTPSVRSLPPSSSLAPSVRRQPSTSSQVPSTKLPTANEELIDDEWVRPPTMEDLIVAPTRFICAVVANYKPSLPPYAGFDWLDLEVSQQVDIVVEAGPPAAHPEIKPVVDDGEDMLLIARRYRPDIRGYRVEVGWVWASFIVPVQDEGQ